MFARALNSAAATGKEQGQTTSSGLHEPVKAGHFEGEKLDRGQNGGLVGAPKLNSEIHQAFWLSVALCSVPKALSEVETEATEGLIACDPASLPGSRVLQVLREITTRASKWLGAFDVGGNLESINGFICLAESLKAVTPYAIRERDDIQSQFVEIVDQRASKISKHGIKAIRELGIVHAGC